MSTTSRLRLTWEHVGGWRAARNHLDRPTPPKDLEAVVGDVLAVQAQITSAAELSIAARVDGLTAQDVCYIMGFRPGSGSSIPS